MKSGNHNKTNFKHRLGSSCNSKTLIIFARVFRRLPVQGKRQPPSLLCLHLSFDKWRQKKAWERGWEKGGLHLQVSRRTKLNNAKPRISFHHLDEKYSILYAYLGIESIA